MLDRPVAGTVSAVVLGIMQDAGLPHIGCRCPLCITAFDDPFLAEYAACLAIVDGRNEPARVWLIDATPDIKWQLNLLAPYLGRNQDTLDRLGQPDGIFLTHAHMGHSAGLAQLGPEAMNVQGLPLYASVDLLDVIKSNPLWRPLAANLEYRFLEAGISVPLSTGLTITPVSVPHRDEINGGTFAYVITGPARSLIYLPDIDHWRLWPEAKEVISSVDIALVDASFYSPGELGGRPPVAHPLVPDTISFFDAIQTQPILIHINHTNPILMAGSPERQSVLGTGIQIAETGRVIELG